MQAMAPPTTTSAIPIKPDENGLEVVFVGAMSRRNSPNFATTKPKPISAIAVRSQARNVRSLAWWSAMLGFDTRQPYHQLQTVTDESSAQRGFITRKY